MAVDEMIFWFWIDIIAVTIIGIAGGIVCLILDKKNTVKNRRIFAEKVQRMRESERNSMCVFSKYR